MLIAKKLFRNKTEIAAFYVIKIYYIDIVLLKSKEWYLSFRSLNCAVFVLKLKFYDKKTEIFEEKYNYKFFSKYSLLFYL